MEAFLVWVLTHPQASVAGMIAFALVVTGGVEWRRAAASRAASAPAEAEAVASESEAVAPESVSPEPVARESEVAAPERVSPEPVASESEAAAPEPVSPEPVASESEAVAPAPEPVPTPELVVPGPVRAPRVSLVQRLARTSDSLVGRLGGLLGGRTVDEELLADLEALLFTADLGVPTAESLLETVRAKASGSDAAAVRTVLRAAILEKLVQVQPPEIDLPGDGPFVILVLGVNGSGKTTTIGKLAARYVAQGNKVILGAADTFRAAAIEQLQIWGERVGCQVIAGPADGDPVAVAFDAVSAARARKADVVIIDTAGRLQTKKPLMQELGKMSRILSREIGDAPHQTLLVLDANTGQNAISQAKLFSEVTRVTDLALTKLDGTAKGGVIVGLADEFGIPVRYVGVGEAVEDLRDFDAEEFVDALFADSA